MFDRKTTLLFIGRDRLVRCDLDSRGRKLGIWVHDRALSAELPELIETTARLNRARVGRTWILAEDLWTQKLTVNHDMLAGLSAAEVARALAFEAESLSGQSAVDSDLGFVRLEGTRELQEFWVVQVPHWIRDRAETAISRAGGKLAGLLHPGGLPAYFSPRHPEPPGGWGRVESWTGVTVLVGSSSDGRLKVNIAPGDSRATAWQRTIDGWLGSLGATRALQHLSARGVPLPLSAETVDLSPNDPQMLDHWLAAWGTVLQRPQVTLPHVVPPKRPISLATRVAIAALLFGLVGAIAGADFVVSHLSILLLKDEIAKSQKIERDQTAVQKEVSDLEKRLVEEKKRVARLQGEVPLTEAAVAVYRRRWSQLLGILAESCPGEVVVSELKSSDQGLTVKGKSLGLKPLNEFTVVMGRKLAPLGWSIAPNYELSVRHLGKGELYSYSLELVEKPLAPTPQAPQEDFAAATGPEVAR